MSMKILIAGGGIAGLTLAQGLRREGIDCELFEREALETWRTGYLLNLDAEGDGGLAACLPEPLYELFTRACGETMARHDASVVVSPHGEELSSMPHIGAPATGERPPTNIDRRTFRAILLSGLDGIVRHGVAVADVDVAPDAIRLRFADGRVAEGDVLVAADGVGSAVRRAVMPDVAIIPAPVGALGLFGRSPLTDDVVADLPQSIWNAGFAIVSDGRGTMLGIGHWRPRQAVSAAAAELGVADAFEDAAPYVMLNGAIPPGVEVPPPSQWTAQTPREMHETMVAAVSRMAPGDPAPRRGHRPGDALLPPLPAPRSAAPVADIARDVRRRRDHRHAPHARQGREHGAAQCRRPPRCPRRRRPGAPAAARGGRCLRGGHARRDLPAHGARRRPQPVRRGRVEAPRC